MKRQRILSLLIYLFHIGATVWGFTEQKTIVGQFSKDCILPCSFPPGRDEVIHWETGKKYVHSYYNQSDHLEQQDLDYKNRTHLFHQNIHNGNASLKLSNLTVTDEGLYKCYVGTLEAKRQVEVMLRVRVSSFYALEYQKLDTGRMLMCRAFLTYPEPHISWLRGNTSIQETQQEKSSNGVLYSLRSDQNITNTADPYYCHIHLPYENWTAEWRMKDQLSVVEGSSTAIPCDYSNTTADTEGFSVVWKLHRGAEILDLAAFNGTPHSFQTRAQVNQSNFSLMLRDLTAQDSGEYVCNISTTQYTKLTVRTLQVGYSNNRMDIEIRVVIPIALLLLCAAGGLVWYKKSRRNLLENSTEMTEVSQPLSSSSYNNMEMCDV
ncbi:HERV-H LTR-associating protein 2 [Indicator indicator]|uniref:HERV-H LTR-associating protein 2 n=1 Tax=Indicator indicator TaxID=1002788 RepID=UPI0023DEE03B|nr:HERV-H LTR-associating protein 2 [Indicator indicator]